MKKLLTASAMTAALFSAPLASQAATAPPAQFQVLLTLLASCTIDAASNMNFGTKTETEVNSGNVTAQSQISVTCSNGTTYDIGLSDTDGDLLMESTTGNSTVAYELYQDSNRTTVWNNTTSVVSDTGNGNQQDFPVYGKIPSNAATIDAGESIDGDTGINLSDTVTVTVTF